MNTVRLTAAQALVRAMAAQKTETPDGVLPLFAGVWAIFGHGNVSGMGEALAGVRDRLPTLRAHNEQAMVHAATAYAKTARRPTILDAGGTKVGIIAYDTIAPGYRAGTTKPGSASFTVENVKSDVKKARDAGARDDYIRRNGGLSWHSP